MAAALIFALVLQAAPGTEPKLADLHQAYEQSCLQRDYGSFDDVCNQLADQIAAYARTHPETPAATPPPQATRSRTPPSSPTPSPAAPPSAAGVNVAADR